MARIKNILNHVFVEVAERKRRCHHSRAHEIARGTKCLVVVEERGNRRNYCPTCAKPMLDEAERQVAEFGNGLGLRATDQRSSAAAAG